MTEQQPKELRLKRGENILNYIRRFSSTEKAVFGFLVMLACVTAIILTVQTANIFTAEVPAVGGHLREGEIGLPRSINPVVAVSDVDRDIDALVYSGLTSYQNGLFVPDIAQSWTISPDGLTYDFILKPDVTFQDGKPLTAEDVAFTIQKIQDPALKSPRQADWENVTVKAVSASEIQFLLKQPYSGFLANTTIGIIPKHIWNSVSDDQFIFSQYNISPIGAGPYKVGSITRDSGGIPTVYALDSWKGYHATQPYIPEISLFFFPNQAAALNALNQGNIDSLPSIDPAAAAKLASNTAEGYKILDASLPRIFGVFFNQTQAPVLADLTVRTALDMATDRTAIIQSVLDGYGVPAHGPIPPGLLADIGVDTGLTSTSSDSARLSAAQALLEKNGWRRDADGIYEKRSSKPKTASTTLSFDIYTANSPDLVTAAKMLKQQWGALGAAVNVQIFEPSDLYQNVIRTRKYDALLFGEQIGKDRDLYAFWYSSERNTPGLNVALYANSKVDALLSDIRSTATTTKLVADYTALDQAIRADLPAIFLYSPDFIYAIPKALRGVHIDSIVTPSDHWGGVTSWYSETQKVWTLFTTHPKLLNL